MSGQGDLTVGLHSSWAELARALGVPRQQVGTWRKRPGFPDQPDEVAARIWHEEASRERRRGPPLKAVSEPGREIVEAMVDRRPRSTKRHSDVDERSRLADAELKELRLAKERGQLISRDEADREAAAHARALLVEAEDLGERLLERLAIGPAEREAVAEAWAEEFGALRDRLAGAGEPAAGMRLVERCLEQLGDRVPAESIPTIRQALAEGLALFIPDP